ncbi:hypothetical protein [Specibacter sp. RAF43]|uniref:hypothetical protein n=1 Tax=Specibacter sp. RAF43 TaxID=3233057 RepID=UPI003F97B83C
MPEPPRPGATFTTTGGVGSIRYTLEEISAAGVKLGRLAQGLEPLVDRLQGEWSWLGSAPAGPAGYPFAALEAMRAGVWSCMRAQADTAALARKATRAATDYASAEAHNAAAAAQAARLGALGDGLQSWAWGSFAPLRLWGGAMAAWQNARKGGARDAAESILNNAPAYLAGLLGPGIGLSFLLTHLGYPDPANSGMVPAVMVRKAFDWSGLATPGRLDVRRVPPPNWSNQGEQWPRGHALPDPPDGGAPGVVEPTIKGALAGSQDAYGYPPGSIGVDRVDRPDGSRAWLVHLPGTEDWSAVDSANPFDLEGDLEGLTAAHAALFAQQQVVIQDLIKAALADAGALPGQDVLITGHSGGGIHAAAAAANPAFLATVNVRMLVIAGSPAKNLRVGPGIAVLDLENEHDLVTATDFGPPPASPTWVTVTSHRPGAADGADPLTLLKDAHELRNYLHDAAAMEGSDDPAIKGARDALRHFLGATAGAPVAVRRFVYQGRDVNDPQPGNPKPAARPGGTMKP